MANHRWDNEGIRVFEEFVCKAIPGPRLSAVENGAPVNGASNDVVFSEDYSRLFERNGFAFFGDYQGRQLRFVVSCETLVRECGAKGADVKSAEPAFLANRPKLQQLAKTLVKQGTRTDGFEIVIE